jgi:hypothetical protein
MTIDTISATELAADLDAADMASVADWVRNHSPEEVAAARPGLLRVMNRYADAHAGDDPVKRVDLELSDRFAALGCDVFADQIRSWEDHEDIAMLAIGCLEMLAVAADPEASANLRAALVQCARWEQGRLESEDGR